MASVGDAPAAAGGGASATDRAPRPSNREVVAVTPDDARTSHAAPYASKSDAELHALERDGSLPAEEWEAVTAELHRRTSRGAGGAPADDSRVAAALEQLRGILVPGETLHAYAVQRRLFALTHRRTIVAATSGRFISVTRNLFGGYTPVDARWQDIDDARLRVGIFGADLTVTSTDSDDLVSAGHVARSTMVIGLRKEEAQRVYRLCQAQEQAWREKRRVRDLDEMRAKSGGIQLGAAGGAGHDAGAERDDPTARLRRAKEMLDASLITDAEYESIKARIVDRL